MLYKDISYKRVPGPKKEFEVIQMEKVTPVKSFKIDTPERVAQRATLKGNEVVAISGGFDPPHVGHAKYIKAASKLKSNGSLIVIVNKDSWLMRKKSYVFMKENERAELIASFEGVDFVVLWDDGTEHVSGCIEILKPTIFANGGDRDSVENVPEFEICKKLKCKMYFGVGGEKIQSSSDLASNYRQNHENSNHKE